jgi:hypothetical protein
LDKGHGHRAGAYSKILFHVRTLAAYLSSLNAGRPEIADIINTDFQISLDLATGVTAGFYARKLFNSPSQSAQLS